MLGFVQGFVGAGDELLHRFVGLERSQAQRQRAMPWCCVTGLSRAMARLTPAKLSNQYAATMAALSGKLRLCKSATTRPESAGLKKALHSGVKPWETNPEMREYFND